MNAVDLVGLQLEPRSGTSLVVLQEHDAPNRVLPILIGPAEAASIAIALAGDTPPRPLAHDVMAALAVALAGTVESVAVTDVRGGTFIAQIAVAGAGGQQLIDARPSDAIALAVRTGARLYVEEAVLEEAGTLVSQLPDEDAIDDAVEQFRHFLEELEPVDFLGRAADEGPADLEPPDAGPQPGPASTPEHEPLGDEPGTSGTSGSAPDGPSAGEP